MADHRELNHKWYSDFDAKSMTLYLNVDNDEKMSIPAKYDVCSTCEGKGSHVNPSIDSHGLSSEDFDDDPEFREDYMSGRYDVPCAECKGLRVVPVVDEEQATPEQAKAVEEAQVNHYEYEQQRHREREMGY